MATSSTTAPSSGTAAGPAGPRRRRQPTSRLLGRGARNIGALLLALLWVFPIYWMVNSSLQPDEVLYGSEPQFWPSPFTGDNYTRIIGDSSFWAAMRMSVIATALAVAMALVSAVLAAAAISRFKFRGKGPVVLTILVIQMIPAEALFISQFRMLDGWGLINSVLGLSVLYAGASVPITIWMLKGFVDGIPYELEEAGQIDGCSKLGAFLRITLPLLAPGIVASGVFALLSAWNEYVLALVVLQRESAATLPLWLARYNTSFEATDWGGLMAASALVAIPVIIVFLFVQNKMANGLTAGAVKG
ncbi:carbohydrate ABC transporter permease [Ruania suaedae]|uniref:carbohydrate ABC transporter permease n=1 Tax=Ruania suaedae TaxID=2897774 RepID=UPI001E367011|nr:carbohydrate ABC transporter permease [Ruania suaedae]UFU03578.1 carbohydrate ABC transporter permease [Ruania suaedae]